MSRFRWAVLAMGLVVSGWEGTARAEPGIFTGSTCTALPSAGGSSCSPGDTCRADGAEGTCFRFGTLSLCIPNAALICCAVDADCPTTDGITFGACLVGAMGGGLCTRPGANYCTAGPVTRAQFDACHHIGAGGPLVSWAEGDCDGDRVPNGVEVDLETDPCLAPARQAVWNGAAGHCAELPIGCDPDVGCTTPLGTTGTCVETSDGGATVCSVREAALYCGDGAWVCPGGQIEVEDTVARHTFCSPPFCGADTTLTTASCVRDPDSGEPTVPDQGDCDHDGIRNGMDETVCEADVPVADGGVVTSDAGVVVPSDGGDVNVDAGAPGEDAGPEPADAGGGGVATDAGANVAPTFGGGGGCACRAAPGERSVPSLLALLGLGLSLRAGRRARRTRRGGGARRSPR